jgi:membrane-associated phospholipid phosphatase
VGFSRIALGAHFLTDVLAAIFFGIVWLALCIVLRKPLLRRDWLSPVAVPLADSVVPSESAPQPLSISKAA